MTSPGSHVPYLRRRNSPAQLQALRRLFDATPHPTRAQRQALAIEIGMELKSVTNWFQNRRQTSRRKSLSFDENNPPRTRSKTPLDRSKISLDRIAALSERPSLAAPSDPPRLPLTPRKANVRQRDPSSPSELWTHMLSSPTVPRSDPDPEETRLAALSSRAKTVCPLEWACLKARQNKWVDEDVGGSSTHLVLAHSREADGSDTEPDSIHPESGDAASPQNVALKPNDKSTLFTRPKMTPQFEDVEAAITLLDFKTRS